MASNNKTVFDPGVTVPDDEKTVPDDEKTEIRFDDLTIAGSDETVLESGESVRRDSVSTYEKGDTILETYHVESAAIEAGGMGRVWRVHHTSWNTDLAMKQQRAEFFATEKQKEDFTHECESWINLGLHPNIVSCYYVREIEGIPTIFAEWMDGGSLAETIESGKLYEGTQSDQQERILDIAIQFARGLHYAHERRDANGENKGIIHQDVKPGNVLLSKEGDTKVADFGLARARALLSASESGAVDILTAASPDKTFLAASGGYTPAYCSMEQMDGRKLTRRTDIYSWAVSVMEMYIGSRLWTNGVVAGLNCKEYFEQARVVMPEEVKELLGQCMEGDESRRPHDFGVIEEKLLAKYKDETQTEYPRQKSKAAEDTADSLNNRALSFLDLGKPDEAEKCWGKALEITPNHAESLYNQAIHLWRTSRIDDKEALFRVSERRSDMTDYYLAKIHLSRGDAESAIKCLNKSKETHGDSYAVEKALETAKKMKNNHLDGRCICTFGGHENNVVSLLFSPDGKTLLSASRDETIGLWDTASGQIIYTLEGHDCTIDSCCFSPDGNFVLLGGSDMMLLEVATGQHLRTFVHEEFGNFKSARFSPDGSLVLSINYDKAELWEAATGKFLRTLEGYTYSVCFSPDGSRLLSCGDDRNIKLWDVASGQCIRTFGENTQAESIIFSPDGKKALSNNLNNTIKMWDVETGKCIRTFAENRPGFESVCFSPDGKTVLSRDSETIELFDIETWQCLRTFNGHKMPVLSVCFAPDGKTAVSGSKDKTMKLWDIETGQCIRTFDDPHASNVGYTCLSPDGKMALSGYDRDLSDEYDDEDITINLWSISDKTSYEMAQNRVSTTETVLSNTNLFDSRMKETDDLIQKGDIVNALTVFAELTGMQVFGKLSKFLEIKKQLARYCTFAKLNKIETQTESLPYNAHSLCCSPDGNRVLSDGNDKTIKLWNLRTGQCLWTFEGLEQDISSVGFSPDGKTAISGLYDNTLKLWDAANGKCIRTFTGHENIVKSVCFSPDGKMAVSGSNDESLKLWDIETGGCIRTFYGHKDKVESVCFSPDGKTVISGSWDETIKLWKVDTGKCIRTFEGHNRRVTSVCFSPDGKAALSGSADKTLNLWDIDTGRCTGVFEGHAYGIRSACFSPDGKMALSNCEGQMMKLWDVHTSRQLHAFADMEGYRSACFSPDGTQIITAYWDHIFFFDIDYELTFPGWADWDDGALPYVRNFLALRPNCADADFDMLITELQNRGYGWLRPEGIRAKLMEMRQAKNNGLFGWLKKK